MPTNLNKFAFLDGKNSENGILSKIGLSEKELTQKKKLMYKINRNVQSKLSKLQKVLETSRDKLKTLSNVHKAGNLN